MTKRQVHYAVQPDIDLKGYYGNTVYNIVFLTITIMLYIRSPEFIHLIAGNVYSSINTVQFDKL